MQSVSTTFFATRFTYKALCHGFRQTPYHMILTGRVITQQVNAIGRFDMFFKNDAVAS
jgi:hypothetical protein